jgi:hypothetical protein
MDQVLATEIDNQEQGAVQQPADGSGGVERELDQVVQSLGKWGTSFSSLWGNVKKQVSLI